MGVQARLRVWTAGEKRKHRTSVAGGKEEAQGVHLHCAQTLGLGLGEPGVWQHSC